MNNKKKSLISKFQLEKISCFDKPATKTVWFSLMFGKNSAYLLDHVFRFIRWYYSSSLVPIFARPRVSLCFFDKDQLFEFLAFHELRPTKRCSAQGSPLLNQRSRVRIPCKVWLSNCPFLAPPVAARFCALKLVDGKCQVLSTIVLVDLPVRSFPWFSPKLV